MADETNELKKLKEENELLKKLATPLTEKEIARLKELQGIIASTSSTDKDFQKHVKEFTELKARSRNGMSSAYATVGDSIKIGD